MQAEESEGLQANKHIKDIQSTEAVKLSQEDDSFQHISRPWESCCHCCSAVYAAANGRPGRKPVILWNNSRKSERLPIEGSLRQVRLRFGPIDSSAFCFLRGSSGFWNHRRCWPCKKKKIEKKKAVASCSTLYLEDHQCGSQCNLWPFEGHPSVNRAAQLWWKYLFAEVNLSYKQIFLIQYSIRRDWPLVREERSINKLSQGLLILWFPQTLNCHGERQGRAEG